MNAREVKILADFKQRILGRFDTAQMVLFGSRARGDAESESDIDVLVKLDHAVSARDMEIVSECAWESCFGQGLLLSPVTVFREEWETGITSSSLLAIAVAEDGVSL